MRQAMEVLLHSGGVDAVFNGHVHAYERSHPVFQNTTMKDGQAATYIVLGDGGNREGHAKDGLPQPAWSAVRNFDTYGHSKLTMLNNTHSLFEWIGNEGGNRDSVYLLSRNWPIRQ